MRQHLDFIAADVQPNTAVDGPRTHAHTKALAEIWNLHVEALFKLWQIRYCRATPELKSDPLAETKSPADDMSSMRHESVAAMPFAQKIAGEGRQVAPLESPAIQAEGGQAAASMPTSQVRSDSPVPLAGMPVSVPAADARDEVFEREMQALMDALDVFDKAYEQELARKNSVLRAGQSASAPVTVSIRPSRAARRRARSYLIYPK